MFYALSPIYPICQDSKRTCHKIQLFHLLFPYGDGEHVEFQTKFDEDAID